MEVKDFGASWRDGVAFLALIDAIKANLVNLADLKKTSNRQRLETAFDVAESKLGIAKILDAEDVDVPKPDEKSIMTYVAQFLHKYPEPKVSVPIVFSKESPLFNLLSSLFYRVHPATSRMCNRKSTNCVVSCWRRPANMNRWSE